MQAHNAPIRFHLMYPFSLANRRKLQQVIRNLVKNEKRKLQSLDFIFCSDEYLLKVNQDFLQHDDYTDIITFDMADHNEAGITPVCGEVYISVERVRENAETFKVPFVNELYRVMFHGVLHLCGYNDKTTAEKMEIRERESYYLSLIENR